MRLAAIILAIFVVAASVSHAETIRLPSGQVFVTDDIPLDKLPAFVKHMTAKQFASFANQRNAAAYDAARARHEAYLAERGAPVTANVSQASGSSTTRYGGGAGQGGFGGAGGYLGYGQNTGSGVSGGGLFGLGGQSFTGNNVSRTFSNSSRSFNMTYPDMNDFGGGPVTIINPFCYDFWVKHTE